MKTLIAILLCFTATQFSGQSLQEYDPSITCNAERFLTTASEAIQLYAWADGQSVTYLWSAPAGTIAPKGSSVKWNLKDARPGIYQAEVVAIADGTQHRCTVRIVVTYPAASRSDSLVSGVGYLLPDSAEDYGFGLYSYFLLGSRPTGEDRQLVLSVLDAYLSHIPDMKNLRRFVNGHRLIPDSQLNLALVPVTESPGDKVTSAWILDHYDFARSAILLSFIQGSHRRGPYLISTLAPLKSDSLRDHKYLYQDLSWVTSNVASAWIIIFLDQTEQENFWEPKTGEQLALKLRTAISIAALGIPDVKNSLNSWLHWGS